MSDRNPVDPLARSIAQQLAEKIQDPSCRDLCLEWAAGHHQDNILKAHVEKVERIHQYLQENNYDIDNQFEYNDLDCHAFVLPWPEDGWSAWCHRDQNHNYLYVFKMGDPEEMKDPDSGWLYGHELIIYRYWEPASECEAEYLEKPLQHLEWIQQYYSDCVPGNDYVNRPTLEWLIENVGTRYKDFRDDAFVAKLAPLDQGSRGAIYNWAHFKSAVFNIDTAMCAMFDE